MPNYCQMTVFKALGALKKVLLQKYVKFEKKLNFYFKMYFIII